MRTNRQVALLASALVSAFATTTTAYANTMTVRDGNDVAIALDIRAVSHGHKGSRLTHTLSTYSSFSSRSLAGNTGIAFAFDTNGTIRSAERLVFVFWASGRLRAVVTNARGRFIAKADVSRPSSRSVKVKLTRASLGNPVGYRWVGYTFIGNAADAAPNRSAILHDITAPRIDFPIPRIPADTTYGVKFSVSDSGGAGVKEWRLQRRTFGSTSWSLYASGGARGSHTVSVTAGQGDDDQYRVVARDRQGNTRTSVIRTVSVPVDDSDTTAISYNASWGPAANNPSAFLQTLTWPSDQFTAAFDYTFEGTYVALVGPGTCASAEVTIDSSDYSGEFADSCNDLQRLVMLQARLPSGQHTLTLYSPSETFMLDGIISR